MTPKELDNLVRVRQLKEEPAAEGEIAGLVRSGLARLKDAGNMSLNLESRFDLAYNAAHALSLAALRWHGYRSDSRYIVFQCLRQLNIRGQIFAILSLAFNMADTRRHSYV